jgi:pimeloyl-ACP methyl ester carboxylesterase
MEIKKHYTSITHQGSMLNIHYRTCGQYSDNVVIMLHPSPLSSTFMQPLMPILAQEHLAIAWDAPGYGDSDKLAKPDKTFTPYIECLALFIEALGHSNVIIYGNATGAQLAIEFSKQHPDKVQRLILENVAWFYPEEQQQMLANYFPDLTPTSDGKHLEKTWQIVTNLFQYFPWYDHTQQAKLTTPMPPVEVLQATFTDYVKAGSTYADAYMAAIKNEEISRLQAVTTKADIILWQDSIIYKFAQRLQDAELPSHIQLHLVESGMENRMAHLNSLMQVS